MNVNHETDRRITIVFKHEGKIVRATWAQPFNHSYHPGAVQDVIIASKAGDAFAAAELQYLTFNYKLSIYS